jgi:hypothetical protein
MIEHLTRVELFLRQDGTVSSIIGHQRVEFTRAGMKPIEQQVQIPLELKDLTDIFDPAYAACDQHNKALEKLIEDERRAHIADVQTVLGAVGKADQDWNERVAPALARLRERASNTGGA